MRSPFDIEAATPRTHAQDVRLPPSVARGQNVNFVQDAARPVVYLLPKEAAGVEDHGPPVAAPRACGREFKVGSPIRVRNARRDARHHVVRQATWSDRLAVMLYRLDATLEPRRA